MGSKRSGGLPRVLALALLGSLLGAGPAVADTCRTWTWPGVPIVVRTCQYPNGGSGYYEVKNHSPRRTIRARWTIHHRNGKRTVGARTLKPQEGSRGSCFSCSDKNSGVRWVELSLGGKTRPMRAKEAPAARPGPDGGPRRAPPKTISGSTREGARLSVACPTGSFIRKVLSARYGARAGFRSCNALLSCAGRSSCSFQVTNAACGGDPKPYVRKSLSYRISCSGERATPRRSTRRVTVSATAGWTSAGVRVDAGDGVTISATGGWTVDKRAYGRVGSAGHTDERRTGLIRHKAWKYDQGHPFGALLYRVGSGPTQAVGGGRTFRASRSGALELRINDKGMGDNAGALRVTIRVVGSSR